VSVPTPQAPNHLFHKVIVLVDDDEEIGTLISELIHEHAKHEVRHHVTGHQALQAMSTSPSHLFILDYNLPDMSGLELHDQLHTMEHLRNVPTLLISSVKPPLRELQKRAITFLAKPFDLMELLKTITKLLA
jgi:cyclic di-GMP phosphodiesterase